MNVVNNLLTRDMAFTAYVCIQKGKAILISIEFI